MRAWIDGLFRCPRLDVVCRGSCPNIIVCGLISLQKTTSQLEHLNPLWPPQTHKATLVYCQTSMSGLQTNLRRGLSSWAIVTRRSPAYSGILKNLLAIKSLKHLGGMSSSEELNGGHCTRIHGTSLWLLRPPKTQLQDFMKRICLWPFRVSFLGTMYGSMTVGKGTRPESIDDHFTLDALNRVYDHWNGSRMQLLKALQQDCKL